MSPRNLRLEKYKGQLRLLQKANPEQRKFILESSDPEFIKLICECCLNAIQGNIPLPPAKERKLARYAPVMRRICTGGIQKKAIHRKRQLLVQHGGFLPALLAPIISLAGGLIGELIGKNL